MDSVDERFSDTLSGISRPNIVMITCHDVGRFLGCYGIPTVRTPVLDEFAADSVKFERAFCTAPQCGPSRSSLYTGRYPQSACFGASGIESIPTFAFGIHDGERHLAQELSDAGYATVAMGELHECLPTHPAVTTTGGNVGSREAVIAARCGFDEVHLPGVDSDGNLVQGDLLATRAIERLEWLASSATRPFYLQVGFIEPHRLHGDRDEPGTWGFLGNHLQPDDEQGVTVPPYLIDDAGARAEVAELQGAVRYMDTAVGRILDRLRGLGLEEDTIVVFTTDHGLSMPRAKLSLYDPGIEVAFAVRYPRRGWRGGRAVNELVSNIDVFPTLLEAVGLPAPERIQGRSLVPLLDSEEYAGTGEIFAQLTSHCHYDPRRCIRTDRHKLIVRFSPGYAYMVEPIWRHRSSPKAGWWPPPEAVELYDLEKDPLEHLNVAAEPEFRMVRRELLGRLYRWMRDIDDPVLEGAIASPLHASMLQELTAAKGSPAT